MIKEISILRALRERKTITQEILSAQERAQDNALSPESKHDEVDFDITEQLEIHAKKQYELRNLKLLIAKASLEHTIIISPNIGIVESGMEVPLFQAILIRDDLKGRKKLLDNILKRKPEDYYFEKETEKWVRLFDFAEILSEIEKLQGAIDEIDAAIQYVDSTKNIFI